ncbi:hypothetical protein L249_5641 [Ophiocordyceps polyrhachis-furcata BCC 54312]|uniref:Uncharacterized protein n=1 Tax=Ophiocordyceps polyrhachis-furcata BCC 54312 TaxID=1330021 RepID=A0A367LGP9_9HYPO|nr:hypothetical protein L249_5641 [Ophiocordyceps polyrhachis-furcata BCC 54312]
MPWGPEPGEWEYGLTGVRGFRGVSRGSPGRTPLATKNLQITTTIITNPVRVPEGLTEATGQEILSELREVY